MSIALFEQAFKATLQEFLIDPDPQFAEVSAAILRDGRWHAEEEWRVMTWYSTTLERVLLQDKDWYKVTVECDGQEFSCRCPTLQKAWLHARVYQRLILSQFYSVGPAWS